MTADKRRTGGQNHRAQNAKKDSGKTEAKNSRRHSARRRTDHRERQPKQQRGKQPRKTQKQPARKRSELPRVAAENHEESRRVREKSWGKELGRRIAASKVALGRPPRKEGRRQMEHPTGRLEAKRQKGSQRQAKSQMRGRRLSPPSKRSKERGVEDPGAL